MNVKKVAGFLVCRSAFTQRNITSIMLVFVFFGVYVLAGGKVSTVPPNIKGLGGLDNGSTLNRPANPAAQEAVKDQAGKSNKAESRSLLGLSLSDERESRTNLGQTRGRTFGQDEAEEAEEETVDPDGLIKGSVITSRRQQKLLQKWEKKPTEDTLSVIEERLKKTRP